MRNFLIFCSLVAVVLFAEYSRADYPATSVPGTLYWIGYSTQLEGQGSTPSAACSASQAGFTARSPGGSAIVSFSGISTLGLGGSGAGAYQYYDCKWLNASSTVITVGSVFHKCTNELQGGLGQGGTPWTSCTTVLSCPTGGTLSGTTCVVPACVAGALVDGYIAATASPSTVCLGGCVADIVTATNQCALSGIQQICGTWKKTGGSCTSGVMGVSGIPDLMCPVGQVPGTFNGSTICLPAGPSSPVQSTTTKTSTDGAGVVTTTKTESKDTGGTVGTTTTTTVGTAPPVVTTGLVSKSDPSQKDDVTKFCEANPKASICLVNTWGGSCGSFSFSGDPILGAMSKEIHQRNCSFFDTASTERTLYLAIQSGADPLAGSIPSPSAPLNVSMANPISQTAFIGQNDLTDQTIVMGNDLGSVVIPWSQLNWILRLLGSIAVAFTLIAGAMIVFKH